MGVLNVKELAAYIANEFEIKKGYPISPVKMQKSLYFLFAFWGGFIHNGKNNEQSESEFDVSRYEEYLFDSRIEAWLYGPVVPDVYRESNIKNYFNAEMFGDDKFLKEFIDDTFNDIIPVSDFKLVDISHDDNSWINHFHVDEMIHDEEIPKSEIVDEYARKELIQCY